MRQAKIEPFGVKGFDAFKAALRRSRTPFRMAQEQSTGSRVSVTIKEPTSAKIIVSAIGLNSLPEGPDRT